MTYKLIATDMDGTLSDDDFNVSKENIKAIHKALDAGIKVVLCSGRSPASLQSYEKKIGLNIEGQYGIGFNGATVYDAYTHEEIYSANRIDVGLAKKIIADAKKVNPGIPMVVNLDGNYMIADKSLEDQIAQYDKDNSVNVELVDELTADHITKNVINICCIGKKESLMAIHKELSDLDKEDRVTMSFANDLMLEFLPPRIDKSVGLRNLCRHLGIEMHEIVTVGDNYNDIGMIEAAGLGIATANAVEWLLERADHVLKSDNNNDTMVEVVDYILKQNA